MTELHRHEIGPDVALVVSDAPDGGAYLAIRNDTVRTHPAVVRLDVDALDGLVDALDRYRRDERARRLADACDRLNAHLCLPPAGTEVRLPHTGDPELQPVARVVEPDPEDGPPPLVGAVLVEFADGDRVWERPADLEWGNP